MLPCIPKGPNFGFVFVLFFLPDSPPRAASARDLWPPMETRRMGKDASGSVAPLQARRDETASKAEPPCQAPEPLCVSSSSLDDHLIADADEVILEDLTECAAAYALPPSAPLCALQMSRVYIYAY